MSDKGYISIESYRQSIRNTRVLLWSFIASMGLNIVFAILFAVLLPLKTVEHVMYEFSSSGQTFYRIDSAQELMSRKTALIRFAIREYVLDKETIDHLTEQDRFVRVANMSSNKVFDDFKTRYEASAKVFQNKKRKITIELDTPFANDFNQQVHTVDIKSTAIDEQGGEIVSYQQAIVGYKFNQQKTKLDDLVHNPLGIEVISYSINKRNSINDL